MAEFIWVLYVVLLAILALGEAVAPEIGFLDDALETAILAVALPGAVIAAVLSAALVLKGAPAQPSGRRMMRIANGCFVGPIVGFIAVMGINHSLDGDIDGGLLLFYMPLLALLLGIIVPVVAARYWLRRERK